MKPITSRQKAKKREHQKSRMNQAFYRTSREVPAGPQQLPCILSNDKARLNVLLNSGAFDDMRDPSKPVEEQEDMKQLLNAWVEDNEDCRVFRQPKSRAALKHDTKGYEVLAPSPRFPFKAIPSEERATLVVDKDGVILAYKFRIPEDLHQRLVESNLFLSQAKRANYSLWAKSTDEIAMSSDYRKHLPESENFFEHNRELWNVLDDVLRLLDPVMYQKYTNVDQFLKEDEKRLAGAWHGAIITRQTGSEEDAVPHKNWKDWGKGLTAMIPWGDYEGGDVKLYNLGLRFELKPCDVLLVNARCVSYGVQEVTKGIRNELDLVVAGTTLKWRHEMVTNGALKRAEERKRIERERRKAAKQRIPLGRRVVGGGIGSGPRPPTSTNSNAIPLGSRSNVTEKAAKKEKDTIRTPALHRRSNSVSPVENTRCGTSGGPFLRSSRRKGDMPLVQMKTWTGQDENTADSATAEQKTIDVVLVNDTAQSPGITAGSIVDKVLGDHVALDAAQAPAANHALINSIATPSAKKNKKQRKAEAARKREAAEKAIMDSVPTEGKTAEQIGKDRRTALTAHYQAKKDEERRNKANKTAAKIAHRDKVLAEGRTAKEIKKAMNAEKEKHRLEQAANRKKQKMRERSATHQKTLFAGKVTVAAPVAGQGTKRKGDGQQSGTAENSAKKPKTETGKDYIAANVPAVERESAPGQLKIKAEPSPPKREVTRENVGGKMREVLCLD